MDMRQDYPSIRQSFSAWWNHEDIGRPLVKIVGVDGEQRWLELPESNRDRHTDPAFRFRLMEVNLSNKTLFGEAFPFIDLNMGPGSMAAYLGSPPIFEPDTVWYREIVHDQLSDLGDLKFDPENAWWKDHLNRVERLAQLAKGTPFLPTIPDILENVDILALLRSPQDLCYDLIDEPDLVKKYIGQIDDIYFDYYNAMYDLVKDDQGGCSYTAFSVLADSPCIKVQCDFSALMSPSQFREFVLDSLRKQCRRIPNSLYHLDGPDAIRHIDALMEIEELKAINWVPGAAEDDGGCEKWYPLYDKVVEAGKSLWISMDQGGVDRFIAQSRKLVGRYGSRGLFLLYPDLPIRQAEELYHAAQHNFR